MNQAGATHHVLSRMLAHVLDWGIVGGVRGSGSGGHIAGRLRGKSRTGNHRGGEHHGGERS